MTKQNAESPADHDTASADTTAVHTTDTAQPAAPEAEPAASSDEVERDVADASQPAGSAETDKTLGVRRNKKSKKPSAKASKPKNKTNTGEGSFGSERVDLRCLSKLKLASLTVSPALIPAPLLNALKSAGLSGRSQLGPSLFTSLAAIAACSGTSINLDEISHQPGKKPHSLTSSSALRIVLMQPDRRFRCIPSPVMDALYEIENDACDAWSEAKQRFAEECTAAARQRVAYRQAVNAAHLLGISPPALPEQLRANVTSKPPRPRVIVSNSGSAAISAAAATSGGLLVVDDRAMPTMSGVGCTHDQLTDQLLNAAGLGHACAIEDPATGHVGMRRVGASVIGSLTSAEAFWLYKAGASQLAATVFVPMMNSAEATSGNSAELADLLRRIRDLSRPAVMLQMSGNALAAIRAATRAWSKLDAPIVPLSHYCAALPDLATRLVILFHLAEAASASNVDAEVKEATVRAVIEVIDDSVLPAARAVLGPVSTNADERDAKRVLSFIQRRTSAVKRILERRLLVTAWPRSMPVSPMDAALLFLCQLGLLEADENGSSFTVAEIVYAAESQLDDLSTDPRRV